MTPGPVRDENMSIIVKLAKVIRDTGALTGDIDYHNGYRVTWNATNIFLWRGEEENGDTVVIAGPIGEFADLETSR